MSDKPTLAFIVQVETVYGTTRLVGRIVYVTDIGELRNPLFGRWENGAEFADFTVFAYLDRDHSHAWCARHGFDPHHVDLDRAESMVRVLRKVRRGMDKARDEQGSLPDDDFSAYLFRVASILGIRTYYVRNSQKSRDMTGEVFSRKEAYAVQWWVADAEKEHGKQS